MEEADSSQNKCLEKLIRTEFIGAELLLQPVEYVRDLAVLQVMSMGWTSLPVICEFTFYINVSHR